MEIISKYLNRLEETEIENILSTNTFINEKILKLFSFMNWIIIKDIKNLDLRFNNKEEEHPIAFHIMMKIFNNFQM